MRAELAPLGRPLGRAARGLTRARHARCARAIARGLNPFLLADLSHARGWDARSRSFVYDMAGPGTVVVPGATTGDFSGEHATTSPALHSALTGAAFLRLFRVLRYTNTFEFNADFTAATIRPQFFGGWLPLGSALARLLREEMVLDRRSGVWKRINFAPPRNATPTAAHYFLNPVLSLPPAQHGARRARLHADGLALAKRKLAMARDPALARVAS